MAPAILLFFVLLLLWAIANVSILHSFDQSRTASLMSIGLAIGYMTGSAAPGMEHCIRRPIQK
jgi:dolichyl-phosphate-mannose--protein O-mannosyl transferase